MIVLGIDPGCRITGYAIAKKEGTKIFLLDYGFLRLGATYDMHVRIGVFHRFFTEKIIKLGVTDLALETPFLGKNAQNFLKLGYLRGILYLLADTHKLGLHEFGPRQVKQSLTGFGGAEKEQVARVLLRLFPAMKFPEKFDVTDAIAVTLCGVWQQQGSAWHLR
jgi:crossover junction endodeoxyribonuclease RuvC